MTRATICSPFANSTIATSAVCTTCAAVKTLPSLEIRTPDPKPSTIDMGSSAEGATSTRLVLTTTTDWLTLRKASRSSCAFVVIEIAENASKLSTKKSRVLVLMFAVERNNCSRPGSPIGQLRKREKIVERRGLLDHC